MIGAGLIATPIAVGIRAASVPPLTRFTGWGTGGGAVHEPSRIASPGR